jgi:cbb3-type cytochrome oxidase subunit 3
MKQEILKNFDLPWLPVTALVIFVGCFMAYAWWTFKKSNREMFDEISKIPLEEK